MKLPSINLQHTRAIISKLDPRLMPADKYRLSCIFQAYVIDKAIEIDEYHYESKQISMFEPRIDPDAWQVDTRLDMLADMLEGLTKEEMVTLIKKDLEQYERSICATK